MAQAADGAKAGSTHHRREAFSGGEGMSVRRIVELAIGFLIATILFKAFVP